MRRLSYSLGRPNVFTKVLVREGKKAEVRKGDAVTEVEVGVLCFKDARLLVALRNWKRHENGFFSKTCQKGLWTCQYLDPFWTCEQ
jgi:hypothetical protein